MTSGINKISDSAAKRKIFDVWSSTSEIINRAPHHEFCPSCCKKKTEKKNIIISLSSHKKCMASRFEPNLLQTYVQQGEWIAGRM